MQTVNVQYDNAELPVRVPEELAEVLHHVASVKRGRFGVITGHQSGIDNPKCINPTISDITFITNPRYDRWLDKMQAAVAGVNFLDVINSMPRPKFSEMKAKAKGQEMEPLFNEAKKDILASLQTSIAGDGEDAHRLGHRLCYATFMAGTTPIKCHLITEPDEEGHKRPTVDEQGYMTVNSLMLPFFIISRKVIDPGLWKPTNSRPLTMMKSAILDQTGLPEWKTISVGKGNFKSLTMDHATVHGLVGEELKQTPSRLADFIAAIGGLAEGFFAAIDALVERVTVRM